MRFSPLVLFALIPILLACSGPKPQRHRGGIAPVTAVLPARFEDAKPHDWQGRGPSEHSVHGIDISRYQTQIDWPAARINGVNFAFIKATEGADGLDPMFADHWAKARRSGVPRGAYHFWYHCRTAADQARWFIRNVPREAGALPPVLDMEWTPFSPTCTTRPAPARIRAEAVKYMNLIAAYYGQTPILYTSIDFYETNEMWRITGQEFWLRSVSAHPSERFGPQTWAFWQYSGTGLVPGIKGKVDLNVFAGSPRAWSDWLAARRK